ncbi:hypothetical protein C7T36_22970 [Rhodococcus sp. AD45-ID]|nr:hypothetical protein C7T36_22970 [Rhodococcus sp. AD45-ID]
MEELGSHEDLIARDGKYSNLWSERCGAVGWRINTARPNNGKPTSEQRRSSGNPARRSMNFVSITSRPGARAVRRP